MCTKVMKSSRAAVCAGKIREIFTAPYRRFMALMMSLYSAAMVTAPTLCVKLQPSGVNMDTLFGSLADIIIKLAFYVGILITVGAIFSLIFAYKDDNAEGQSRAVRLIVVGVMLVGFETVLRLAGIIQ